MCLKVGWAQTISCELLNLVFLNLEELTASCDGPSPPLGYLLLDSLWSHLRLVSRTPIASEAAHSVSRSWFLLKLRCSELGRARGLQGFTPILER